MSVSEYRFEQREQMLDALYRSLVEELKTALATRARATLLLSGGSTPAPLYRRLAQARLDWSAVRVALVDERWVEPDSDDSNERLIRETLLTGAAAAAAFVGMKNAQPDPFSGAAECNRAYSELAPPFDIALLGMGPDGHTASLFPRAEGLEAALASQSPCAAIRARRSEVTGERLERMTMTPWGLLQSRKLILLISGEEKWRVYRDARQNGASADLPISLFTEQAQAPLEVYWAP